MSITLKNNTQKLSAVSSHKYFEGGIAIIQGLEVQCERQKFWRRNPMSKSQGNMDQTLDEEHFAQGPFIFEHNWGHEVKNNVKLRNLTHILWGAVQTRGM